MDWPGWPLPSLPGPMPESDGNGLAAREKGADRFVCVRDAEMPASGGEGEEC